MEEALIEMYLAGVSVRRVEDITEALWGSKVSASTISELNKKSGFVDVEMNIPHVRVIFDAVINASFKNARHKRL